MNKAKRIFERICALIVIASLFFLFFMKVGADKVFDSYWVIICKLFHDLTILTKGIGFWNIILFLFVSFVTIKLMDWAVFYKETEWEREDKKEKVEMEKSLQ